MPERSLENKRILITGIAGFGGSWLAENIIKVEKSSKVFGIKKETTSTKNIDHIISKLQLFDADITNERSLNDVISEINPQIVFHLAAIVPAATTTEDRERMLKTNVDGTINLLGALDREVNDLQIFHFASTSSVYKENQKSLPIKENDQLDPHDPYSESKIKAENFCKEFFENKNFPIVITRSFNQGGVRCTEDLIANKVAKMAAVAKKEGQRKFVFGNVNAIRDFTDVRDIVFGYLLTAKNGRLGEIYNLCSGQGIKVSNLIDTALDYVGLKAKVRITSDTSLFRKEEPGVIVGDNSKAKKELEWKPKIPFEQTLKEMIDYYLSTKVSS